jgi:YD repeat-containing protein
MTMKKAITVFVCTLCTITCTTANVFAQGGGTTTDMPEKPMLVPPSPSVASFQEFTSIPVSHNNGQASFSITLAEVKTDVASFPVTLSYKTNGVKVNDVASVCGLGWDITAGGVISRIIKGKPDENSQRGVWKLYTDLTINPTYSIYNQGSIYDLVKEYVGDGTWRDRVLKGYSEEKRSWDFELDMFTYNFMGYSGVFYVTHDRKVRQLEEDGLKFSCLLGQNKIIGFTAYDKQGRVYHFGEAGGTETINSISLSGDGSISPDDFVTYNSAWHLVKLTKLGYGEDEKIEFTYTDVPEESREVTTSISFDALCSDRKASSTQTNIEYITKKLFRITWSQGCIDFKYSLNSRVDFFESKGAQLDTIKILYGGSITKQVVFQSTYIATSNTYGSSDPNNTGYNTNRLFLNGIKIMGDGSNNQDILEYSFAYHNPNIMAGQKSYAQDLWGYYNGKNNTSLNQSVNTGNCTTEGDTDRSTGSLDDIMRGALTRVTYPTKGYANFIYEINDYYCNVTNQTKSTSGLRILSMEYYDNDGVLVGKKKYNYNQDGRSSGTIPSALKREYYMSKAYNEDNQQLNFRKNVPTTPPSGYGFINGNTVAYTHVMVEDMNSQGTAIGGKETFIYNGISYQSPLFADGELVNLSYDPDIIYSWRTGKLTRHDIYGENGETVKTEELTYEEVDNDDILIPLVNARMVGYNPVTPVNSEILVLYLLQPVRNTNRLVEKKVTEYFYKDGGAESTQTVVTNTYDTNIHPLLPSRIKTRSNQQEQFSNFQYHAPIVYDNDGNTLIPSYITERKNGKVISGVEVVGSGYSQTFNSQFNPTRIKRFDTNQNSFVDWRAIEYNSNLKVSSIVDLGQPVESYLWGYNKSLPIAKVLNAIPNEVYHTSFEDDGTIYGDSKTGMKVCTTTFAAPLKNLINQKYILSHWKLEGKWQYVISEINVNDGTCLINIPATSISPIDEVRFYPANSQMETYTWKQGVGVTSVTDPNGRTTYYEYDSNGRLVWIKDEDKKIIQKIEYNFKDE